MREILFRGKEINGKWAYGLLSESQGIGTQPEKGFYISSPAGMPWAYQVRPETVGQFTGLLDRNGKKVFDGDILQAFAKNGKPITRVKVFWCDGFWDGEPLDGERYSVCYAGFGRCKVIGNIYGAPELLGTGK